MDFTKKRIITVDEFNEYGSGLIRSEKFNAKWVNDSTVLLSHKTDSTLIELVARGTLLMSTDTLFDGRRVVFRKVERSNQELKELQGSYVLSGKSFQDSLDFVTDSLVLSTGSFNSGRPLRKWYLIEYKNHTFLTFQGSGWPLLVVTDIREDSIMLQGYSTEVHDFVLSRNAAQFDNVNLLGIWKEERLSVPKPPPPPGAPEGFQYMELLIDADSIRSNHMGRDKIQYWKLTEDGKRIYFPDNIYDQDGSWKILKLTEDSLWLKMNSIWLEEVDVKLVKQD